MSYSIRTNSWNQAFPDLNQARRNHAGVFVPLCTADPNDGLPGLWVFGGRTTSDDPPFGDPEYFPIACSHEGVLVISNDWDFDEPGGGGLPYYTTALDNLGSTYQSWNATDLGFPSIGLINGFDTVIMFTGYDWQTSYTPQKELVLQEYLDTGGNLLLSSQEYRYASGSITPFMQTYLGIDSIVEDAIELDPTGNPGDPIGNGLGPYAMVRPDQWAVYWPSDTQEGPYDDYVYSITGAGEPFSFNVSGEPNSTWNDSNVYKTVYLGWPFEWIGDLNARSEILDAILEWFEAAPPTATPVPPTNTPIPPTNTPVPPTNTPVPPTNTPVPPTATVPTGVPTNTPVPPTNTPIPPTNTPLPPTNTPVPPTSTPECTVLGCEVYMPKADYVEGDECYCDVIVCNPNAETYYDVPVFVILDVYGLYFFAPGFSDFDYYVETVAPGKMTIQVLPSFTWPGNVGSATGILWYAAMTNAAISELFGELGIFSFGWH
jgi:hypothetical protein